jgi:hypothetical protein
VVVSALRPTCRAIGVVGDGETDFITNQEDSLVQLTASPSTAFDSAPLRKVGLNTDYPLTLSPSNFRCLWTQVTDTRLSNIMMHVFEADEMIYNAVNLVSCELSLWIRVEETNVQLGSKDVGVRILPSLQTLILHVPSSDVCPAFFEPYRFPSLSRLEIMGQGSRGSPSGWSSAAIGLIGRSECMVGIFSTTLSISSEAIEPLFDCMPSLTSLHILLLSPIPSSIFERMSRGKMLTKLKILDCQVGSFTAFVDYLESCFNMEIAGGDGSSTGICDATYRCVFSYTLTMYPKSKPSLRLLNTMTDLSHANQRTFKFANVYARMPSLSSDRWIRKYE